MEGWSHKTAQSPHSWLGACSGDAERLCAGQASISRCLIDRERELTPACHKMVEAWEKGGGGRRRDDARREEPRRGERPGDGGRGRRPEPTWMDACTQEAERVCGGKTSISLCMAEHVNELSPECRKFMGDGKKKEKPRKK